MPSEQANAFKKHRDAEDAAGNLTWAARLQSKAVKASPEALARIDVEREFELGEDERVLWRLLKLPRKYMDIEHSGVLPVDKLRGVLRGLVAADVVDILDGSEAKALIPAEVRRLKAEVQGKELQRPSQPLKARVYRPNIDGTPPEPPPQPEPAPAEVAAPRAEPSRAPAPVQTRAMTDDDRALKAEVDRAHAAMGKQNHYEFLGLVRGADDAAVRTAYVKLAREFHPDRIAGLGDAELQTKVDALFKRLGDAQQAVGSADARMQYDRTLDALGAAGVGVGASGQRQRRPLEAQNAFKIAEVYFKKKELKNAEAHYRQAANFDPEDARILTALAWCIYINPDHDEASRTAEAKKRLQEVVNKHRLADAAYKLGLVLRKQNDEGAAQRSFAQAHRLDPQHHDAEREVRLHEQRAQKQGKQDGLFGRFMKK